VGGDIQNILLAFGVLYNISILEFHCVRDRWPKNEMIFFPNVETNYSKRKDLHFWISEGPLMWPIVLWGQAPAWLLLYLVKKQPVAVNWPVINISGMIYLLFQGFYLFFIFLPVFYWLSTPLLLHACTHLTVWIKCNNYCHFLGFLSQHLFNNINNKFFN